MATINTEYLVAVVHEADAAPHGHKGGIYQRACAFLGVSMQTLHREMTALRVNNRKRRSDAGCHQLSLDEAKIVSAYLMEGFRKNNKKMIKVEAAVESLRANGLILASAIDETTGELTPLSASAVSNALRTYNLHPEQLRRPSPHIHLRSLHPNHVWQVDASVCTLYYLPAGEALIETNKAVHYKNKPENMEAISQQRVIRYVVTDHCSGVIRWRYYPHSESGENTIKFLAWAVMPKAKLTQDPFYGVPLILMVDPGATSAGLVKRFCDRLTIELHVNKPGAPRSKGQVEKGQDIVETNFEQGLRFCGRKIRSIDELNAMADIYQRHFNSTVKHTRHGQTRHSAWMHITEEQLRIIHEDVDLFSLATSNPETRVVAGDLTIQYLGKGRTWKVNTVPFASVGDTLTVCHNPLSGMVMAVVIGADDRETYIELQEATRDDWGFFQDGPVIGENYTSHKDTVLDQNRKEVARIATGAISIDEAKKKRRRKGYEPFDGRIDPFITANTTELPAMLPRAGRDITGQYAPTELLRMSTVQAAKWLLGRLGDEYRPELLTDVQARFPEGATEEDLEQVLADLAAGRAATGRAKLQAV